MAKALETVVVRWDGGTVSSVWHEPPSGDTFLVLGHGAGGTLQTPGMVAFAQEIARRGLGAVRFNFPYAEARRKAPDPQPRLEACFRAVAEEVALRAPRIFLGGRSMGGRIASHVAADGFPAAGLVFLSYPLHPPSKPERIRNAHLARVRCPMLFLQGSRDAFARPDLVDKTVKSLPRATLFVVEGGDHSLTVRGRTPGEVLNELADVTAAWVRKIVQAGS